MSASPNNPVPGPIKAAPLAPPGSLPAIPGFPRPDHKDLETLLALSSLHDQIRRRRAQELDKGARLTSSDSWELKQLVPDEVLQLIADRAVTVTGADGVAVALVDGSGIVCRASAGKIAPERGARLDPYSGFSGACLRTGEIVRCDDSERDKRVSAEACRRLGTRSMVAVPLATSQAIIGVLEAFSTEPLGFNDSDVRSLSLLGELILDAMKPEEEHRLSEISRQVVTAAPVTAPGAEITREGLQIEPLRIETLRLPEAENLPRTQREPQPATPAAQRDSDGSNQNAKLIFFSEYEPVEDSRPGLKLVILLVMLAIALGTGLWWQVRQNTDPQKVVKKIVKTAPSTSIQPRPVLPTQQGSDVSDDSQLPTAGTNVGGTTQAAEKSGLPAITGIRHWSSADSSTVVIDLQDQVQYEAHRLTSPERIYFDLLDTSLAHGLFGKVIEVNDPVLQRIRIAQPKQGVTRVVLDTKGASNYSVSMEQNPYRLVVEIGKLGSKVGPSTKMNLFGPAVPAESDSNATAQLKVVEAAPIASRNAIAGANGATPQPRNRQANQTLARGPSFSIVLDAGHGGWDLGTVGRKGLEEKDLVLDIVQRLGGLLEKQLNAKVIYTRHDDSYVALEKRAEIANLSQGSLFVSIHANYSDLTSARGVETYYTNTYSSVKARPTDADNEPSLQNIDWTRVDIREKVQESHHLAECVQEALYGTVAAKNPGIRNRGVKKAQYVVLTGTSMPGVLAEISFVSSPTDETELQGAAYRQRIAEALYKGIARYHETHHRTTMASLLGKSDGR